MAETRAIRLAVFDCDGTLVDSQAHIVTAMTEAFVGIGLAPPPPAAIRAIIGLSLDRAVAGLLPEPAPAPVAEIVAGYRRAFAGIRRQPDHQEALYPGVVETLAALDADGWLLGVATGKSRRGLIGVLEHHGLSGHFVTLQTADRAASKPSPEMLHLAMAETGAGPNETVLIGDTTFDMEMAANAGVGGIGVSWGYHPVAHLRQAGARHVVNNFNELPPLLNNLMEGG